MDKYKFYSILGSRSWVVAPPCELLNPSYWQVGMVSERFVLQFNHSMWACTRYILWEVRLCLCVEVVMANNNVLKKTQNYGWSVPPIFCISQPVPLLRPLRRILIFFLGFQIPPIFCISQPVPLRPSRRISHHGQAIFWANHASGGPLGGLHDVYVGMVC
jgi:hypothetical protein